MSRIAMWLDGMNRSVKSMETGWFPKLQKDWKRVMVTWPTFKNVSEGLDHGFVDMLNAQQAREIAC